jgi:phage terminase large subunit
MPSVLNQTNLDSTYPPAFAPLQVPARYKAVHGGRGSGKSHYFAEELVLRCWEKKTRAVCIREVQHTIRDSVRQLLVDKIQEMRLGPSFEVLDHEIRGDNGSIIIFRGMQNYNAENIKSLEDFDLAWVEEAQTLSDHSLLLLRPTIRKEGSELWFSWNPRYDTDAVDKFFRGGYKRKGAIVVEANWQDNPWFPDVLMNDKTEDYEADPETSEHVWGGGYLIISEGSYYARLLMAAEKESRVGNFPYNPDLPLITSWDIGVDDYTAIWFVQEDGFSAYVVDFFEVSGVGAEDIVRAGLPELVPDKAGRIAGLTELGRAGDGFEYSKHLLPHDVMVREWGAGARTRYQTLKGLGVKPINVGVAVKPDERINAARRVLPLCHFNSTQRVMAGLAHLRRYSKKKLTW